jgi:hypothetical protein
MTEGRSPPDRSNANERQRMKYAKQASSYDKESDFDKRWLYGTQHRTWACFRATGTTLEVAIGTGLNLPLYPPEVRLVGLDLTPEMADGAALTPRVGANGYLCRRPLPLLHDGETIVLRNDLLDIQDHLLADDAELLIDCEEDRTLRAVLVGMLREAER